MFTPGSTTQIVAGAVVALCGLFLCVSAALDERVFSAVVAAAQFAVGAYLASWNLRERRRRGPAR